MNGLLRNNFYSSAPGARFLAGVMVLAGIVVVLLDNDTPTLLISYMLFGMVGFSLNSLSGLQRENTAKWGKYKLTAPVRRTDIIKSYFICQVIWLAVGMIMAFAGMGSSILLHGFPFDRRTDILMIFVVGAGVSLFMGAFFFPLYYMGGNEKNEVTFVASLLCAVGITAGIAGLLNYLFGPKMSLAQLVAGAAVIIFCASASYAASYHLTVSIFRKKEY